jgi:hypothetical protein
VSNMGTHATGYTKMRIFTFPFGQKPAWTKTITNSMTRSTVVVMVRTSVEMHICDLRRFMSLCYSRTGDVVCCRTFGVNRETVTKNAYFRYRCCPLNF